MKRTWHWIPLAALAAGCSPQAGEAYIGEPLLRMRGQVTTSMLKTTQPITPALCFTENEVAPALDLSLLPAEVQAAFERVGFGAGRMLAHILDVETEGAFPAEFKVNVYVPPPPATLQPLFAGEPRSAWGTVCAVQAEHGAVSEAVSGVSHRGCARDGRCSSTDVVMTSSGSRYYAVYEQCPPAGEEGECALVRTGDVELLTETGGFENVVAQVFDPALIYLADPAPAGSYTAYLLGAVEGLPAGYHLRKWTLPVEDESANAGAQITARERAITEANSIHGTSYTALPDYADETGFHFAPSDVVDTFSRLAAKYEMEMAPDPAWSPVSPDDPGLTLDLNEDRNWEQYLPAL